MMMKLSANQAKALAHAVAALRTDWDHQGIYVALGKAQDMGTAYEVAMAALRAAQNPENRTPAVIAMQGPHWAVPKDPTSPALAKCPVHEVAPDWNCPPCRSEFLVAGTWPTGTRHHQAPAGLSEEYTDARTRAAGDDR